jgi:hypothetical protein
MHRFAAARAAYRRLPAGEQERLMGRVAFEEWLARGVVASWVVLALAALGAIAAARRLRAGWRDVLRPPVEVVYLLPVAALFFGAALSENWALGHAIELILVAGLGVAWVSGALLDVARRAGGVTVARAAAHSVAAFAGVVAICFLSVMREGLLDMLIETVKFGVDR